MFSEKLYYFNVSIFVDIILKVNYTNLKTINWDMFLKNEQVLYVIIENDIYEYRNVEFLIKFFQKTKIFEFYFNFLNK